MLFLLSIFSTILKSMWNCFYNENTQYTLFLRKKSIELSNLALSKNTHSSHWMIQFPISKWNTYGHDYTYKFKWRRKVIIGISPGKKHFCLNYLYLSDKIVFWSGIIQMTASFICPLNSICTSLRQFFTIKKLWRKHQIKKENTQKNWLWVYENSLYSLCSFSINYSNILKITLKWKHIVSGAIFLPLTHCMTLGNNWIFLASTL